MTIIFRHEKPRKQLLEKGVVYTIRRHPRSRLGRDWATDRRDGEKIANVYISLVGCFPAEDLTPYVAQSGFETLDGWVQAYKEINPGILGSTGWLYRVELRMPIVFRRVELGK